jgi:hypothetical protein
MNFQNLSFEAKFGLDNFSYFVKNFLDLQQYQEKTFSKPFAGGVERNYLIWNHPKTQHQTK